MSHRSQRPFEAFRSSLGLSLAALLSVQSIWIGPAQAYPVFAQQNYAEPREANGRIVCANCHLAQKPADLEVPQAVLPGEVFGAVVSIPYDQQVKQVLGNGKKGGLNVGAVLILPEGFEIAPPEKLSGDLAEKVKGIYFTPYSPEKPNIIVVGPLPGKKYSEMTFPIIAPNPATNPEVHYLNYPLYLGANRGRGQVYPDGKKSNNTTYNASATGIVASITEGDKGVRQVEIRSDSGTVIDLVPAGPTLTINEGSSIEKDQVITNNPNVGGFGQAETEIILQNPARVQGLILFLFFVTIGQVFLVLKKKQFEKVQLAEMNF
jgi:apocytochrome f